MITLLIADDHPLYRDALKGALEQHFSDLSIHESHDLDSTLQKLEKLKDIDLLLLDLNMPGSCDFFGLIHISQLYSDLPIAVVSGMVDAQTVNKSVSAGAQGFIPKTADSLTISRAINHILEGEIWIPEQLPASTGQTDSEFELLSQRIASLTPAQYNVLCYMKEGLLNKQIAANLEISEATVKAHVTAVFKKLGINNRSQAALLASQLQLNTST